MKKSVFVTLIVLALIVCMLPMSTALAKREIGNVNISVRNITGAPISIIFTDSLGLHAQLFTFEPGRWNLVMAKGTYTYSASTICGSESGSALLDHNKVLSFHCYGGTQINVGLYRPVAALPR
ncbi:MAG: hypothetical protein WCP19_14195 [Chloroflexota bacterium]